MRKFIPLILLVGILFGVVTGAQAQQSLASAILYNVDASNFPTVTAFVDVSAAQ